MSNVNPPRIMPKSRLCIYFFYDPDGLVDEYVFDCLKDLAQSVNQIIFVSNSSLNSASRKRLSKMKTVKVTERSNKGFDVWAYKHGIDTVGWENIAAYDEVIFMNFTIVGPLYPLKEMFTEMDKRPVDFWGINVHSGESYDPWGVMEDGLIPKHLQSHFIAVRNKMLRSPEFQQYWDTMRPINSYQEAIGFHEAIFTRTFEALGYSWDSYIDTSDLEKLVSYPLMFMPKEVIINRRSPFFKRKALLLSMDQYIGNTTGETVSETLESLKIIGYDVGKVMPNILRTGNQYDIRMAYRPVTIISNAKPVPSVKNNVLVSVYVDSVVKLSVLKNYLPALDSVAKVIIVTHPKVYSRTKALFETHSNAKVLPGKYSDLIDDTLLEANNYPVVGIIGFGSYSEHRNGLSEYELYKHGFESLFVNPNHIAKVGRRLLDEKIIGIFAAPQSVHGNYGSERNARRVYYRPTDHLLKNLNIRVNHDPNKLAFTSETGMFWIKSSILTRLPRNLISTELGKMSNQKAMRTFGFALPFIAQSEGQLMSYLAPETIARTLIMGLMYRKEQQQTMIEGLLREGATSSSPPARIYYEVNGLMSEKNKVGFPLLQQKDGTYKAMTMMPVGSKRLRFDPIEGRALVCKHTEIFVNGEKRKITARNGIAYKNGVDIFLTNDPQYIIEGEVNKGDRIVITIANVEMLSRMSNGELQEDFKDMRQYHETPVTDTSWLYKKAAKGYHTLKDMKRSKK